MSPSRPLTVRCCRHLCNYWHWSHTCPSPRVQPLWIEPAGRCCVRMNTLHVFISAGELSVSQFRDTGEWKRHYIKDEAENKTPSRGGLNPSTPAIWSTLLWCCWLSGRERDLMGKEKERQRHGDITDCSVNSQPNWMQVTNWIANQLFCNSWKT